MTYAIIPAGGVGSRMGLAQPKQYHELAGLPILIYTLRAFEQAVSIEAVVLVVPADHLQQTEELVSKYQLAKVKAVVAGGRRRQDSVANGLAAVPEECELVAVHDGARPLVNPELIDECVAAAGQQGAAMAAIPVSDTLKEVAEDKVIQRTVDRSCLWQAQTPQVVPRSTLARAFVLAREQGFEGTDEASFMELVGQEMVVVSGSEQNIKVTRPDDLAIAELLLGRSGGDDMQRVGHGYDAHQFCEGRPLVLGGVTIPHDRGLLGHSDADVLCHALCDAILGALGQGDIGRHFPDSDQAYKGISSLLLLQEVAAKARAQGYGLVNADITVIAQAPKLAPYWAEMQQKLADCCQVEPGQINLKGTTTEKMGFTGRQEGIATHAVVMMGKV